VRQLIVADAVMVLLAAVPVVAIVTHVFLANRFVDRWIGPPDLLDVARLYGRTLVAPFLGALSPVAGLAQTLLIIVAAATWWHSRSAMIAAFGTMLVVGAVSLPVASQLVPVLLDRTALFLLAPLVLLLACGSMLLRQWLIAPTLALLIGLELLGVANWHRLDVRKERWDLAAEILHRKLQPDEPIVMTESAFLEISLAAAFREISYVSPRMVLVPPNAPMEQLAAEALGTETVAPSDTLPSLFRNTRSIWLVMRDLPALVDDDPGFTSRQAVREALTAVRGRKLDEARVPGVVLERWAIEEP
jgi:hypothetical protein